MKHMFFVSIPPTQDQKKV